VSSGGPRVAVVGGGLAGLTAALRLADRGYRVTVYEQKRVLGGNLGSRRHNGVDLDVYPHMYCNWYANFWQLHRDVTGCDRTAAFRSYDAIRQLARGDYPRFTGLVNMYSPWHGIQNLFSGVGPPADMYVFGYAGIDLLAEKLNRTMRLDDMSVTGFLNARPYMTTRAAAAYDTFITRIWGIPSYLTSAQDFRLYLSYAMGAPTPAFWLPRGSAQEKVIAPLVAALERRGVDIRRARQVVGVTCGDGRVRQIATRASRWDGRASTWVPSGASLTEDVDELILAVPPLSLVKLIRSGADDERIVDWAPELAQVSVLRSVQVPIVNLFFNRKLRSIPPEPVGLADSGLCLAFTDISQTWEGIDAFRTRTVLAVSASDLSVLPGTGADDDAHAMLVELARYVPFDAGSEWGDSADVDWTRTRYEANIDAQLFVNEAGSDDRRPVAAPDGLANLTLAGDFCRNEVGLTTIESAVTTGLEAARAIVARRGVGEPVTLVPPTTSRVTDMQWVAMRYALAPYAAAASTWSLGGDLFDSVVGRAGRAQAWLGDRLTGRARRR